MKWLSRLYWRYVYQMEIERGINLETLYLRERLQISTARREALAKLRELGVEV